MVNTFLQVPGFRPLFAETNGEIICNISLRRDSLAILLQFFPSGGHRLCLDKVHYLKLLSQSLSIRLLSVGLL